MKGLKYFAITAFLTASAFAAVTYTSCTKEACNGVTCLNGGACSGGMCTCKDSVGIGGSNCEIIYRKTFAGQYQGFAHNTGHSDSTVFIFDAPNDTTNYASMTMTWSEPHVAPVSFAIQLTKTSSDGSTFAVQKTTMGNKSYVGNGAINGKTATIYLSETIVNPTDTVRNSLSFSNLIKVN